MSGTNKEERILIVEDSPVLRMVIRRALVLAGVVDEGIREAGNGQEAFDSLAQGPADVILLDLNMPIMDGYTFIEEKAKRDDLESIKVIIVSTEGNESRLEELRSKGVHGYLRKPFEPETLRAMIDEVLHGEGGDQP